MVRVCSSVASVARGADIKYPVDHALRDPNCALRNLGDLGRQCAHGKRDPTVSWEEPVESQVHFKHLSC